MFLSRSTLSKCLFNLHRLVNLNDEKVYKFILKRAIIQTDDNMQKLEKHLIGKLSKFRKLLDNLLDPFLC